MYKDKKESTNSDLYISNNLRKIILPLLIDYNSILIQDDDTAHTGWKIIEFCNKNYEVIAQNPKSPDVKPHKHV